MIPTGKANLLANLTTGGFFVAFGQFLMTPAGMSFASTVATAALAAWARNAARQERRAVRAAELERIKADNVREDRIHHRFRATVEEVVDVAVRQALARAADDRARPDRPSGCRRGDRPDLKLLVLGEDQADGLPPEVFDAIDSLEPPPAKPHAFFTDFGAEHRHPNHDDHAAQSDRARG